MVKVKVMTNKDEQFEIELAGMPNQGHYIEFDNRYFLVDSVVFQDDSKVQLSVVEMF